MTIEEIKNNIRDIPIGSKGLAMAHPIKDDVCYYLQQLLLKWEFDEELFDEVLNVLEDRIKTIRKYQHGEYKDTMFEHMTLEKWLSPAQKIREHEIYNE